MTRKEEYDAYLLSDEWKELRRLVLKRDGFKCMKCGETGFRLNIHHFTYERLGNELLSDVGTFCKPCHWEVHETKFKTYQDKTDYWNLARERSKQSWKKPQAVYRYIFKGRRNGRWRIFDQEEDRVVMWVDTVEKALEITGRLNSDTLGVVARARLGLL